MGLMYPKTQTKKKRHYHKTSILQNRAEGTCYLCVRLHDNYQVYKYREEHHIFGGPDRTKSEAEGLKVYLCIDHHRTGAEAVHKNAGVNRILKRDAQRIYEKLYGHERFMKLIGKSYTETEDA